MLSISRSATVYVRVTPEIKDQAEQVYNELGISMTSAVEVFLRASIRERGFPFPVNLTRHLLPSARTKEEIDTALREAFVSMENEKSFTNEEVKEHLRAKYGIKSL